MSGAGIGRRLPAPGAASVLATVLTATMTLALLPAGAAAQNRGGLRLEARGTVYASRRTSLFIGAGAGAAVGNYARVFAVAGGGPVLGNSPLVAGRVEAGVRLLADPFAQSRTGLYAAAGVAASGLRRWRERHAYLFLVIGMEGPAGGRLVPALEVGLGDGARLGVVIRQGRRGSR